MIWFRAGDYFTVDNFIYPTLIVIVVVVISILFIDLKTKNNK